MFIDLAIILLGVAPLNNIITLFLWQRLEFTIVLVMELGPCRASSLLCYGCWGLRSSSRCIRDFIYTMFTIGIAILIKRVPWGKLCCCIFWFIHIPGWTFVALHYCNSCVLARVLAFNSIMKEIRTSQFFGEFIIHYIGTLVHHHVGVMMDWDELVQRERPLSWPTSILKDLSAIPQDILPLIFSFMLGNKCNKYVTSIIIILIRLDWFSIAHCPCCLLNLVIHLWVVFLEIMVSMRGSRN